MKSTKKTGAVAPKKKAAAAPKKTAITSKTTRTSDPCEGGQVRAR